MSNSSFRIIAECYADTALAQLMVSNKEQVDHANGSSQVASEMKKLANSPEIILVGFIDNDKLKNMPRYFDDFTEYRRGQRVSFRQKEDFRVQHYLIVLERAIETFLLHNAAKAAVKVTDFGFSDVQSEFQKRLKTIQIENDIHFISLLKELQKQKAPDFVLIGQFLQEFIPYRNPPVS